MNGPILFALWIGGIIGVATIAVGSGQNKSWTLAEGLAFLAVWPLFMCVLGLYVFFGAKMGELKP